MFQRNPKQFYRELPKKYQTANSDLTLTLPSKESLEDYWHNIWSKSGQHNSETTWLTNERQCKERLCPIRHTHQ